MKHSTQHPGAIMLRERLKAAFKALRQGGYFARLHWKCCQTCGTAAIPEDKDSYVFAHAQDMESLWERGNCYLSWGGDPEMILVALRAAGIKTTWKGLGYRILVEA